MGFHLHIGLDQPANYIIKLQGRLTGPVGDWFQGSYSQETKASDDDGLSVTTLVGIIADQSALHGLLRQIRDLGLTLLYVDCTTARGNKATFHLEEEE